jgi:hypothetical protein
MHIAAKWAEFGFEGACPISFSDEEVALHEAEIEEYNEMVEMIVRMKETLGVSEEGRVSHERYEAVKAANEQLKNEVALSISEGDEELRKAWLKWWPFSDKSTK